MTASLGQSRPVIDTLLGEDSRVRFLDLPKGENRGERNRDAGVRDARGDVVVYLADDDLLLPRHVENLLTLLEDVPFAQSRNGCFDADDNLRLYPTDLGDPECIEWHLKDPPRNRVSITGTAHTREAYLQLERGWEVPPGNDVARPALLASVLPAARIPGRHTSGDDDPPVPRAPAHG